MGSIWHSLVLFESTIPRSTWREWVKSREVAIRAASNPGEIWNEYILDTRSKGCRYASLLGVKKQKKKLEDRGNRSPVRTRYTPVLKSYVPCIVFYNITIIDQLFCTTSCTPNDTQISPPTRFAVHWCHLQRVNSHSNLFSTHLTSELVWHKNYVTPCFRKPKLISLNFTFTSPFRAFAMLFLETLGN